MAIRKLFGTGTADAGVFWDDVVNEKGWRIQKNETFHTTGFLKPFRLLDPMGNLWASADTLEEMVLALPDLVNEFSQKEPLFSGEEMKSFMKSVFEVAGIALTTAATQVIKSQLESPDQES